jgi:hypothetical protein
MATRLPFQLASAVAGGLVLLMSCAHRPNPPSQDPPVHKTSLGIQESIRQLSYAQTFSFDGIGFAGNISPSENAFFNIYRSPGASDHFSEVFARGTSEGKIYSLVGLYELDRERFDELTKNPIKLPNRVSTMSGCIVFQRSGDDFVDWINEGRYSAYLNSEGKKL